MLDDIKNNSIVICTNDCKIQLLKGMNKLISVKFMNIKEFLKSYLFDFDERAILHLIKNYNVNYDIALEYLKSLYYIEDKFYNIKKLDILVKIKNDLISNNLLIFDDKFKKFIKDKNIIIYKYYLNKFEKHILLNLDNVTIIEKKCKDYIPTIYEFETQEKEIEFVASNISNLIYNGVDISKIKLTNISNDYINDINKIFNFYNLKAGIHNNVSILSTIIGNTFFVNMDFGLDEAIKSIDKYKDDYIYNQIVNICNKYIWCNDLKDLKVLIYHDMLNANINYEKYTSEIEVVDYKTYNFDDEYVFMLNFNMGIIPKITKDEGYLTDSIKPPYLDTTLDINNNEKNTCINSIKNIKNLIITYKLQNDFNIFYPSTLVTEFNGIKYPKIDMHISYSEIASKLRLTDMIDNLIKFDIKDSNLPLLYNNYNIDYNSYSNKYTKINKNKIQKYIRDMKSFNISYTSMDNYNRCAFRFYLSKILNIKDDIDSFGIVFGNIFHHIIEFALTDNINIDNEVDNFIKKNNINLKNSEKFFVERLKSDIRFIVDIINNQNSHSKLNKIETEKYISVNVKDNINFVGFIDKILYGKYDDNLIASIVDYKTYVKKPSLKYIDYGIGLQLPSYMYLAKNEYKNITFSGIYLQNVILNNNSIDDKKKSLKLIGFSNKNEEVLKYFDDSYKDSEVIDSLKVNNDGNFSFNSLKNMLNDEEFDEIIIKTQNIINETINNILNSNFDINPKFDKSNIGCEFCKYQSICFMNNKDLIKIDVGDDSE